MGSATHSYRGFITAVTNNDVREVIVTIHEQEFVNPAFQGEYSGVIAANIVRSACSYWGSRPTDVSIIPCHGGSFRPESCRVLGRELKGMLTPNVLETVGCVPLVEFKEQDVGGLRGYKSSGTVLDDEFYVAMSNACRIFDVCERRMGMEGQMSRRVRGEVRGNGMEKYSRRGLGGWWEACGGVWAKGWGDFQWLANRYVKVTLPSKQTVVVSCDSTGTSRCLYFSSSVGETLASRRGGSTYFDCLQFVCKEWCAFDLLDHVIELNLPVTGVGADGNGEGFPRWFCREGGRAIGGKIEEAWKRKPGGRRLWEMEVAVRAVTEIWGKVEGFEEVQQVTVMEGIVCDVAVGNLSLELDPLGSEDIVLGSDAVCNFCNLAKSLAGNEKLNCCASCKSIWYCGAECQRSDWKRHRSACKIKKAALAADASKEVDC